MDTTTNSLLHHAIQPRPIKTFAGADDAYRPLLAIWLIELTLFMGWHKKAPSRRVECILEDGDFAELTGIEVETEFEPGKDRRFIVFGGERTQYTNAACVRILKRCLEEARQQPSGCNLCLFSNIELIGKLLGMTLAEKAILGFAATMEIFPTFKNALATQRSKTSTQKLASVISMLFGLSEQDVRSGLREDSALLASGLVKLETGTTDLEDKMTLLEGLGGLLLHPHADEELLIGKFLKRASCANLSLQSFPHLTTDATVLKSYLGNIMSAGGAGTNVLLYGVPGTGKTEFTKALARELGADLYEISYSDDEGNPIAGYERLRAYNLCQRILVNKANSLLMFDEIEDIFESHDGYLKLFGIQKKGRGGAFGKAWINRTLERNSTPAIWVTNDAEIDPAYLRRFDYSIRFPVPPQKVRMEIARHHLAQFEPTEAWLSRIATNEQMTPAQYERAAKVARVSHEGDQESARLLVEQALDRSATLLGQKQVPSRNAMHTGYDLSFVNTSIAMPGVIAGLNKKRQGSFCFYGPAGTGKSELARHIADELGMPCLLRRASDILSMWVGGTEKNIATMFAEARQQEALLVLDEADSFLADRRDAKQSWEVTQVNELLTQMEAFSGIFVCTTNLMDKLDQASLRRFAFKVKFDYLHADQRWAMFVGEYARLGGNERDAANWERQVRDLAKLTPGDFAVAARQLSILDAPVTAAELYHQLREECRVKGGPAGKMGFVS